MVSFLLLSFITGHLFNSSPRIIIPHRILRVQFHKHKLLLPPPIFPLLQHSSLRRYLSRQSINQLLIRLQQHLPPNIRLQRGNKTSIVNILGRLYPLLFRQMLLQHLLPDIFRQCCQELFRNALWHILPLLLFLDLHEFLFILLDLDLVCFFLGCDIDLLFLLLYLGLLLLFDRLYGLLY